MRRVCCTVLLALLAANAVAAEDARARMHYLLHCSGCHQADGSGNVAAGIPRMRGEVGHFLRLPQGRAFLVQVPGTSQSSLSDAEVAALLNWMVNSLSGSEVPADFTPYTADEVTLLRAHRLSDAPVVRGRVVEQLRSLGYGVD